MVQLGLDAILSGAPSGMAKTKVWPCRAAENTQSECGLTFRPAGFHMTT